MEVKIDKRTKEYKESVKLSGEAPKRAGFDYIKCSKCGGTGKGEGCMEQGGFVKGLCPECCGHRGWYERSEEGSQQPVVLEQGLPEKVDFSQKANNPGFKLCCVCGEDTLELNDDGSQKRRKFGEPCDDCRTADYNKAMIGGTKVDIDPTKPPQPNFNLDGSVTYEVNDSRKA